MNLKNIVYLSILISLAYNIFLFFLNYKQLRKELPKDVLERYGKENYNKYVSYANDKNKCDIAKNIFNSLTTIIIISFGLYPMIYYTGDYNKNIKLFVLIAVSTIIGEIINIPFEYYRTFTIDKKHDLNNTTKKVFILDKVKEIIPSILLLYVLSLAIDFLYNRFGANYKMFVWIAIMFTLMLVLVNVFYKQYSKIYNKYDKLTDEDLISKINKLLSDNQMEVKEILIKDASKRTKKGNASCLGLFKKKTIILYDTLFEKYSNDEITAIIAHELGHIKNHDIYAFMAIAYSKITLLSLIFVSVACIQEFYTDFGFHEFNVFWLLVVSTLMFSIVLTTIGIIENIYYKRCEKRADIFAIQSGYGNELYSSLNKLSVDNLTNPNPHPIDELLNYTHPVFYKRLAYIRKELDKLNKE